MSEGVDEEGIRVVTHRPEIDITKGKGDLEKAGGSVSDIERRVLKEAYRLANLNKADRVVEHAASIKGGALMEEQRKVKKIETLQTPSIQTLKPKVEETRLP